MDLKQNKFKQRLGEETGYILAYLIFSIMIFFILLYLNKISPTPYSFLKTMFATLTLTLLGIFIKRLLK